MNNPLHTTWMILKNENQVLLGHKKRGFGKGNLNGVGGKVDPGETIEQAAVRETLEEVEVKVLEFEKVGTVIFDELIYNKKRGQVVMHCLVASKWEGEPKETDEIIPEWFDADKIPYEKMWIDDEFWLPQVLTGKKIEARFKYNDDYEIVEQNVKVIEN